jgi:restriction endonuclease
MAQRLKRWESPRNEGRNDKGKGGSARQRQLKKRTQMLRQKLKDQGKDNNNSHGKQQIDKKGENYDSLLFLWPIFEA